MMKKLILIVLGVLVCFATNALAAGGLPEVKIDDRIKESGCPPCCPKNVRAGALPEIIIDDRITDCGISPVFQASGVGAAPASVKATPQTVPADKSGKQAPIQTPSAATGKDSLTIALNIEFDSSKAVVQDKYYEDINKVVDFMKKNPTAKCLIQGHTDNVGNDAFNKALSEKRAKNVRQYIIDKFRIDGKRITAEGFGGDLPIASNDTEEGRKKNRRVEVVVEVSP
jgi:OOP family OmpA-OmpF porin